MAGSSTLLSDVIAASPLMFSLWLVIASAYMPELAGCQVRRLLGTSMVAKHFTGLVAIYYTFILATDNVIKEFSLGKRIAMTLLLYAWFILTTRCDAFVLLPILGVVFGIYMVSQQTQLDTDEDKKQANATLMNRLFYVAAALTAVGVTMYARRKMIEYGDDFDWATFFIGRMHCDSLRSNSTEVIEPA